MKNVGTQDKNMILVPMDATKKWQNELYSLIKVKEATCCAYTHTPKCSSIEELEILKGQDGGKVGG